MFLMYRALNDFDVENDVLNNGLLSKKMLYDLTYSYLETNEKAYFNSLIESEKDIYCKENMLNYVKRHKNKMKKIIDKRGNLIRKQLDNIECCDSESWARIKCYLSTLNTHLINGSRTYTDWISASKDLGSLTKYYQQQDIHKIAVLGTIAEELMDENTLVVDLSSKEIINNILPLLPKNLQHKEKEIIINKAKNMSLFDFILTENELFQQTNEKFVGYNYASHDKEVCIYRYFPDKNVVSVLEALQIDLISLNMFNFNYLTLSKEEQVRQLKSLKEQIKRRIIKLNDPYLLHIFNELYIENKNIKLVRENIFDDSRIKENKVKILKIAKTISNIQIK